MRPLPETPQEIVHEIAGFAIKHLHYKPKDREFFEEQILSHWKYGTLDFMYDPKGLIFAMRYNISHDSRTCFVEDLAIRKDKRNFKLLKFIIARNWSRWPTLTEFKFKRLNKYPEREPKTYKLSLIFRKR